MTKTICAPTALSLDHHHLPASLGAQEVREQRWVDQGDHGEPIWESEEEENLLYFLHTALGEKRPVDCPEVETKD